MVIEKGLAQISLEGGQQWKKDREPELDEVELKLGKFVSELTKVGTSQTSMERSVELILTQLKETQAS